MIIHPHNTLSESWVHLNSISKVGRVILCEIMTTEPAQDRRVHFLEPMLRVDALREQMVIIQHVGRLAQFTPITSPCEVTLS
jgi:hypothetical protein